MKLFGFYFGRVPPAAPVQRIEVSEASFTNLYLQHSYPYHRASLEEAVQDGVDRGYVSVKIVKALKVGECYYVADYWDLVDVTPVPRE